MPYPLISLDPLNLMSDEDFIAYYQENAQEWNNTSDKVEKGWNDYLEGRDAFIKGLSSLAVPHQFLANFTQFAQPYLDGLNFIEELSGVLEKVVQVVYRIVKSSDNAEVMQELSALESKWVLALRRNFASGPQVRRSKINDDISSLRLKLYGQWNLLTVEQQNQQVESQIRQFITRCDLEGLESFVFALRQSCQIDESRVLPPIEMKAHCELALRVAAAGRGEKFLPFFSYLLTNMPELGIDPLSPGAKSGEIALHHAMKNAEASSIKALLGHEQRAKAVQQLLFSCNAEGGNTPKRPIDYLVDIVDGEKREQIKRIIMEATTQDGLLSPEIAEILAKQNQSETALTI